MRGAVRPIVLLAHVLGACASTSTGSPAPQGASTIGEATSEAPAAREPARQASPEEAAESKAVAKQFLGERGGGASRVGPPYQWLTVGRLYWVVGPRDPDVLVAVLGDGRAPVRLTGDIPALKDFLAMQFSGRLPDVSALSGIAQLVKDAIIGKRGRIATPEFFESQRPHVDAWLKGRERDSDALKRVCSGIRRSLHKNEWTIEFNVINGSGGVDVVRASGTASPLSLLYISVEVVKARGEFTYPSQG
jgi:hypothetical protein